MVQKRPRTAQAMLGRDPSFWFRLAEESQEAIGVIDTSLRPIYANSTLASLLRIDREQFLRSPSALDFIFPEDVAQVQALAQSLLVGGTSERVSRFRRSDGSPVWARAKVMPFYSANGTVAGLVGMFVDVTLEMLQQERMERLVEERTAELTKRSELLQALIDNIPAMIAVYDAEGRFQMANPALERALGWKLDGRSMLEACYPDPESMERAREFALKGGDWADFRMRTRWGTEIEATWAVTRLSDGTFICIGVDISLRKHTEHALRESERLLAESGAELRALAERLITTQEEHMRTLGRELHDDISQRLAALAMELDALAGDAGRSGRSPKQKLRRLAETTMRLADDVHALSRQLHPSTLSVLGLPVALESECSRLRGTDGLAIEFQQHNVAPHIPPDQALALFRIAQEALRNIVRHARATSASLELTGADSGLELSITDNGVGFDSRAVRGKGGLGLVSMEERARLASGELHLRSAPGRGTAITVRIPLLRTSEPTPTPGRA